MGCIFPIQRKKEKIEDGSSKFNIKRNFIYKPFNLDQKSNLNEINFQLKQAPAQEKVISHGYSSTSEDFTVWEFPEILTLDECNILIEAGKGNWKRSRVQSSVSASSVVSEHRSSSTAWVDPIRTDAAGQIARKIRKFAAELSEIPNFDRLATSELQLVRYDEGQQYRLHTDSRTRSDGKLEGRGTLIVYLSDNFEGGETWFPVIEKKVKPEIGKGALWYTKLRNGKEDKRCEHAGLPVTKGTKYICTQWFSLPQ